MTTNITATKTKKTRNKAPTFLYSSRHSVVSSPTASTAADTLSSSMSVQHAPSCASGQKVSSWSKSVGLSSMKQRGWLATRPTIRHARTQKEERIILVLLCSRPPGATATAHGSRSSGELCAPPPVAIERGRETPDPRGPFFTRRRVCTICTYKKSVQSGVWYGVDVCAHRSSTTRSGREVCAQKHEEEERVQKLCRVALFSV